MEGGMQMSSEHGALKTAAIGQRNSQHCHLLPDRFPWKGRGRTAWQGVVTPTTEECDLDTQRALEDVALDEQAQRRGYDPFSLKGRS